MYVEVNTYTSASINSPMVIGLFKSKLILPSNYESKFSCKALALILEHESIHIQRKDNLTNFLFLTFAILVWFNPFVWFAYASFRRLQELSTDEEVLRHKTIEQQILYSKALINCAANSSIKLMAYSHYGDKHMILKRLKHIKSKPTQSRLAKAGLILVATCMLGTLAIAKSPNQVSNSAKDNSDQVAPIVRVDPNYPGHAVEQGLSGSVVLKYDIAPFGETSNISIISDSPKGVFNREAKKALAKWKYEASAQGYQNVLVQIDFVMNEEVASATLVERVRVEN